jgi:hypothetical protein
VTRKTTPTTADRTECLTSIIRGSPVSSVKIRPTPKTAAISRLNRLSVRLRTARDDRLDDPAVHRSMDSRWSGAGARPRTGRIRGSA